MISDKIIIGVDEAGRGPLFGSVYASCTILPNELDKIEDIYKKQNIDIHELEQYKSITSRAEELDYSQLKDSKRFSSSKKLYKAAHDVKRFSLSYSVSSCDENVIDKINIREATFKAMHSCILDCIADISNKFPLLTPKHFHVLVDGNAFKPLTIFRDDELIPISFQEIVSGDDKIKSIMAASILAKTSRDDYIERMCNVYPFLDERYKLLKNKGYGTKQHIDGIREFGYSEFHRKTFKLKTLSK